MGDLYDVLKLVNLNDGECKSKPGESSSDKTSEEDVGRKSKRILGKMNRAKISGITEGYI